MLFLLFNQIILGFRSVNTLLEAYRANFCENRLHKMMLEQLFEIGYGQLLGMEKIEWIEFYIKIRLLFNLEVKRCLKNSERCINEIHIHVIKEFIQKKRLQNHERKFILITIKQINAFYLFNILYLEEHNFGVLC